MANKPDLCIQGEVNEDGHINVVLWVNGCPVEGSGDDTVMYMNEEDLLRPVTSRFAAILAERRLNALRLKNPAPSDDISALQQELAEITAHPEWGQGPGTMYYAQVATELAQARKRGSRR